jgi:hypothetical protein
MSFESTVHILSRKLYIAIANLGRKLAALSDKNVCFLLTKE